MNYRLMDWLGGDVVQRIRLALVLLVLVLPVPGTPHRAGRATGDAILVGAIGEDREVAGANGNQTDISASSATEPYGLSSMEQFDRLPYLKKDTVAEQTSSFDRAGSNRDGWAESNFLYTDANHHYIMGGDAAAEF